MIRLQSPNSLDFHDKTYLCSTSWLISWIYQPNWIIIITSLPFWTLSWHCAQWWVHFKECFGMGTNQWFEWRPNSQCLSICNWFLRGAKQIETGRVGTTNQMQKVQNHQDVKRVMSLFYEVIKEELGGTEEGYGEAHHWKLLEVSMDWDYQCIKNAFV